MRVAAIEPLDSAVSRNKFYLMPILETQAPFDERLKLLKVAHAAFLAKAWECYGDPIFVCSMMHTVHQAMMDLEHDFLEAKTTEKANGKKRDS